ncbi:inhibitor of the pro-sigma K processing machinery [Hydrogenoanaerobacterium saccharovorans]|uniref:Inhibitor of the pro-sigma K processing machinery n=1 Tax=Hydrogenoanaerobacterium saccharovorans TaxID=474960 RepID=A0A1H8A4V9_9FIRM|nr:pro-sigmaK processing inhibitor BofA family protein [Hydrogenoanaerobacterium saccharovorans]RPF48210.1 inhibitor of the pro-sigma K processing machinery [Hydrogenoanaerobacterium saccharovorans]SEM64829.1 inhibitor of the pro-sigma K processing machinery [Hydrogenoanaerobacterium saccharovorans]
MTTTQAVFLVCGIMLAIFMITIYARTGKPLRSLLGTAVPGVLSLAVINYASYFTGVGLLVNVGTLFTAVFLGLPGVISIFILKLIWAL